MTLRTFHHIYHNDIFLDLRTRLSVIQRSVLINKKIHPLYVRITYISKKTYECLIGIKIHSQVLSREDCIS